MVGLGGETSNRQCTDSLSLFATQTAAAQDEDGSRSDLFSLREKGLVERAGFEPATT